MSRVVMVQRLDLRLGIGSTVYSKLTLGVHVGVRGCLSRATARENMSMVVGLTAANRCKTKNSDLPQLLFCSVLVIYFSEIKRLIT